MPNPTDADLNCVICTKPFKHNFVGGSYGGTVCSKGCYEEYEWRRVLSVMGTKYYPKPKSNSSVRANK